MQYSIWRCVHCDSLHAVEPQDLDKIYVDYPLQRQRLDIFTRATFRRRLYFLRNVGLRKSCSILDYGGGAGTFAQFLREAGFSKARSYDPHMPSEANPSTLDSRFDFVLVQDVIEHAEDPIAMLRQLKGLVVANGKLIVGTPDAEAINLDQPLTETWSLHQPLSSASEATSTLVIA